jgi:hypothetical protein
LLKTAAQSVVVEVAALATSSSSTVLNGTSEELSAFSARAPPQSATHMKSIWSSVRKMLTFNRTHEGVDRWRELFATAHRVRAACVRGSQQVACNASNTYNAAFDESHDCTVSAIDMMRPRLSLDAMREVWKWRENWLPEFGPESFLALRTSLITALHALRHD